MLVGALGLAACGSDTSATTASSVPDTTDDHDERGTDDDHGTEDGSGDAADADQIIAVTVATGSVEGGADRHAVDLGAVVAIEVTVDVADRVHVHGYDLFADAPAGATATIVFVANIPGVFEVELEGAGLRVAGLEVS